MSQRQRESQQSSVSQRVLRSTVFSVQDDVAPSDSASQVERNSVVSATSSAAARRLNIAATRAKIEAKLALDVERHRLEFEELQLKQRKQELDLKTQLAMVNAEDEVLARAESPAGSIELRQRDVHVSDEGVPSRSADPDIAFNKTNNWIATVGPPPSDNSTILQMISDGQRQQKELIDAIRLPAAQLVTYDGEPLRYWTFIRSFENSIASSSVDDSEKLTRLIHYCSGQARKVIECCAIMEPHAGYAKAKQLLKDRFGNDFVIAEAWIRKVTNIRVIKPDEKERLQEFADDLNCCRETLSAMGFLGELNGQSTLLKVVEQLPNYLQLRFKREVRVVREKRNRNPNIDDILEFVREAAAEANDPVYGKLAQRDGKFGAQAQKPVMRDRNAVFAAATSTSENPRWRNQQQSVTPAYHQNSQTCILCGENHTLFRCNQFKSISVDRRINLVKQHNLCFNCLMPGHTSNRCQLTRTCSVPGCNRKHTKFLHPITGQQENPAQNLPTTSQNNCCAVSSHIGAGSYKTVLPIVPVIVSSPDSTKIVRTYALLDSGSTNTFCSNELIQQFGIKGRDEVLSLTTLEKADSQIQTTVVNLEVSNFSQSHTLDLPIVYTKDRLPIKTHNIATADEISQWPHL